jgi:membrane-bound metal-dependent hydrolase YbcI (DUF457 family)
MFIGHFGLAMAGKKIDRKPSLAALFLAAQWLDLIWPLFLLLGWEHIKIDGGNNPLLDIRFTSYPYSHSLIFAILWSFLIASIYYFVKRDSSGSFLMGFLVFSHWLLDFFTHIPDLPITPWSDYKVGLGLWNHPLMTVILEGLIFIGGIMLYVKSTRARALPGYISFWSLMLLLVFFYVSSFYGAPPDSEKSMGYFGLTQWLIIAWAYWIDRTRMNV